VSARGFTLLEVLVAIALIGGLLLSMLAFVHNLLSSRDRALAATGRRLAAAALIEHIEHDLMTCVAGDLASGSGIQGDGRTLRVMSRGVAVTEPGLRDGSVLGDLQVSEYRFDENTGLIEARRLEPGDAIAAPDFFDDRDVPVLDHGFEPLGRVHLVRLRYLDDGRWRDDFDSLTAGRLPVAVEVAVWYRPWPGQAEREATSDDDPGDGDQGSRLTFDDRAGGFDEAEYARRSDVEGQDEPRPDRVRVIVIPDGSTDDPYGEPPPPELEPAA